VGTASRGASLARPARGVTEIQWASIEEAHQKVSENELSCVLVQYIGISPNAFRRRRRRGAPRENRAASPQDLTISNFFFGGN